MAQCEGVDDPCFNARKRVVHQVHSNYLWAAMYQNFRPKSLEATSLPAQFGRSLNHQTSTPNRFSKGNPTDDDGYASND
ncbi:hypothetical protein OUZ56_019604 [Daphnia magna]|uniref:Uncharacterized protein n=1 Tax=Daphnia magna TaxID=35525 RepID=A0ABQ9ZC18_9CRUS|nr:hypothetical protein OUZ56_019604 [Daphnia magna]